MRVIPLSKDLFFISDQHINHERFLEFKADDGTFIRPDFANVQAMNEHIVEQHNKVVKPTDEVWFLGDVVWKFNKNSRSYLLRMNGIKHLCIGNHDDAKWLKPHFEDIQLWHRFSDHNLLVSHVPIHGYDLVRTKFNIHGHLHEKRVCTDQVARQTGIFDTRYLNVGVELMGYQPIHIEDAVLLLEE
jgi:calcineurin-like phosphoesterase family protein